MGQRPTPGDITWARTPYKIDEVDANTTYLMYYNDDSPAVQVIVKVYKSGTETEITKAEDYWINRTSATYTPINT